MSKFSRENKQDPKTKMVGVWLSESEHDRLTKIAHNKGGYCREAVIAAMDKHDYGSEG